MLFFLGLPSTTAADKKEADEDSPPLSLGDDERDVFVGVETGEEDDDELPDREPRPIPVSPEAGASCVEIHEIKKTIQKKQLCNFDCVRELVKSLVVVRQQHSSLQTLEVPHHLIASIQTFVAEHTRLALKTKESRSCSRCSLALDHVVENVARRNHARLVQRIVRFEERSFLQQHSFLNVPDFANVNNRRDFCFLISAHQKMTGTQGFFSATAREYNSCAFSILLF